MLAIAAPAISGDKPFAVDLFAGGSDTMFVRLSFTNANGQPIIDNLALEVEGGTEDDDRPRYRVSMGRGVSLIGSATAERLPGTR